jgi:hypothetical protein
VNRLAGLALAISFALGQATVSLASAAPPVRVAPLPAPYDAWNAAQYCTLT